MKGKFTDDSIVINADIAKVWDVLVNPKYTQIYMFTCEAKSDWKVGSSLLWVGSSDNVTYVKGTVEEITPKMLLKYSVIDPLGKYEDVPENYLHITYELHADKGVTTLRVTQGDYTNVANGEERYNEATSQGGWSGILTSIKEIAER